MVGDCRAYIMTVNNVDLQFCLQLMLFSSRTRYFSEARKGHTPLHGRAYYQMMECLGVSFFLALILAEKNCFKPWHVSKYVCLLVCYS